MKIHWTVSMIHGFTPDDALEDLRREIQRFWDKHAQTMEVMNNALQERETAALLVREEAEGGAGVRPPEEEKGEEA